MAFHAFVVIDQLLPQLQISAMKNGRLRQCIPSGQGTTHGHDHWFH
jgi:hypothetical protein